MQPLLLLLLLLLTKRLICHIVMALKCNLWT